MGLKNKIIRLFYPPRCCFCGRTLETEDMSCSSCNVHQSVIVGKICKKCGRGILHCMCPPNITSYDRIISCFYYDPNIRRGVLRFKFHGKIPLAKPFGMYMARLVQFQYSKISFDAIVSVPSHWLRLISRGYNCSALLADELHKQLHLPVLKDVIYKSKYSKPQKRVAVKDRLANLLDTYALRNTHQLAGKTILLVDDVTTSGATLSECAKMLKLGGAKKVYCVTLAAVGKNRSCASEGFGI